jgi:hypothetical protein
VLHRFLRHSILSLILPSWPQPSAGKSSAAATTPELQPPAALARPL